MTGLDDLKIYRLACKLEIGVYELAEFLPADEKFRQVDQMKRASASVCDNIAEGYGKYSFQSKIQSFYIARGEATEVKNQIDRAIGKGFVGKDNDLLSNEYTELIKGINGYIRYLKDRKEKVTA